MTKRLILAVIVGFATFAAAQQNPDFSRMNVNVLPVQGQVHMLVGAGGNVAVQAGDEGVLLVDTGYTQMSEKLLAAVRKVSAKPIRAIVNTSWAQDHTGGNEAVAKAGSMLLGGPGLGGRANEADMIAHGNALQIMTDLGPNAVPVGRWPTSTFLTRSKDLYFNDEPVVIMHQPNANTSGDVIVWFRKSDVVATGDIFREDSYPFIDAANGGSINGIIDGLNTLLEIIVPKHLQEGGTMVIPGHGRLADEHDVLEYRDMVTIIRNRIQRAMKEGKTLDQIKAAKPAYEYEPRWGRNPAWTGDMFVEAIYKSLSEAK